MHPSIKKKEVLSNFSDRAIALCYITLIFTFSIPKFTSFNYDPNINLTKLAPHLGTFAVSFVTISAFWVAQSRIMFLMKEINVQITWQYRAYFVCLVLVSITAVSLSSDPFAKLTLVAFNSFLLLTATFHISLLYTALNLQTQEHAHLISILKPSLKRIALFGPACYLLAIAAIFVNIYTSFSLIIVAMFFYIFFLRAVKLNFNP